MYGDSPARLRVWEWVIEAFMEDQEHVDHGGQLLVITAGPPGAGKSSAVESVPKVAG